MGSEHDARARALTFARAPPSHARTRADDASDEAAKLKEAAILQLCDVYTAQRCVARTCATNPRTHPRHSEKCARKPAPRRA